MAEGQAQIEREDSKWVEVEPRASRSLVFHDGDAALAALERLFVALGQAVVVERDANRVRLNTGVDLLWDLREHRRLVVRAREWQDGALGAGNYELERRALDVVQGVLSMWGPEGEKGPTGDCYVDDRALGAVVIAFGEEMASRGFTSGQEEVLMTYVELIARDASGRPMWLVSVCPDTIGQSPIHVANLADPCDPESEQELLEGILERALGREVRLD